MLRYLPLVLKSSVRNRRRSLLTMASIALSFCLLGLMMAMYAALYLGSEATPQQALRLITRNKVSLAVFLPLFYGEKIGKVPGVREQMVFQWFGGTYKDDDPMNQFARFGVEPRKFATILSDYAIVEGSLDDFVRERTACIVGTKLQAKYGWKLGDRITLQGDIFPVNPEFIIRGFYEGPEDKEGMFFDIDYLYESLPARRRSFAGTFYVLADSRENVAAVARQIDEMFANSTAQTKTETERAFALSFVNFLGNVKMFLMVIFGAVTFTILLVAANTMAMSARERVPEVGILKTLGFTRGAILAILLGEAALLACLGAAAGLGLTHGLTWMVRQAPAYIAQFSNLQLQPATAAVALVLALVMGTGSALIPSWHAARTPIVDALRATE